MAGGGGGGEGGGKRGEEGEERERRDQVGCRCGRRRRRRLGNEVPLLGAWARPAAFAKRLRARPPFARCLLGLVVFGLSRALPGADWPLRKAEAQKKNEEELESFPAPLEGGRGPPSQDLITPHPRL